MEVLVHEDTKFKYVLLAESSNSDRIFKLHFVGIDVLAPLYVYRDCN